MTLYTFTAQNGHTGVYLLDVYDLDAITGNIINASVSYGGCNGYNTVTVDKKKGPSIKCNVTIYGNLPPIIPSQPSGPTSGTPGATYSYTTNTTDPDGDDIYYWFDWGDGTDSEWLGPYSFNETCTSSNSWSNSGTYQVKAKAKDEHGAELGVGWSNSLDVTITQPSTPTNLKPTADFTYLPTNPRINQTVNFTDKSVDSDGFIADWIWEFGDGNISTLQSPTYIYSQPGNYLVNLTVTDDKNAKDTEQKMITVLSLPQNITWEKTTQIALRYNNKNKGNHYLVWKGSDIYASNLAKNAFLSDGDTISVFSKNDGDWLTYTVGISDQSDFQISLWDIIIIKSKSEKTITLDISQQNISAQSVTIEFTNEETTKKSNMGYNFFAWTSNTTISVEDFLEIYDLSNDSISVSLYDPETSSWSTYNPSLPMIFNVQFNIEPYSIICIKVEKNHKESVIIIT